MTDDRYNRTAPDESSDDSATQNIKAVLRHIDLPVLEEAELITVDRESGEIERGPNFEKMEPLLNELEE